jgi:flagellar assembly protein FliH
MANVRKYGFDTEFAPDGAVMREAPKRLSPEEIAAECAAAYERGKQDAVVQAERKVAAALEALADAASAVLTRLDTESAAMREEAARIAMAAARKISGEALDAFGVERAVAAVEAAMDALRHQPRLLVKLPAADAEILKQRIAAMCETHAYAGAILVRAETSMRAGEVVIDWSDGVVTLSPAEAAERINTLVEAALAAQASTSS